MSSRNLPQLFSPAFASYSTGSLNELGATSVFKTAYKHFKKRDPLPSLTEVLDPRKDSPIFLRSALSELQSIDPKRVSQLGLRPIDQWNLVTLVDHEGLYILTDIVDDAKHLKWIDLCLKKYPESGLTNVHLHLPDARKIFENYPERLRWTTLGVHYDWSTKLYANDGEALPTELTAFASLISTVLGLGEFHSDAAIINYFPLKGTLGPHVDQSERDLKFPLISMSLGQDAIYLTGGTDLDSPVESLLLRSGDVLVMHGNQRLVYHAVPSIRFSREFEPVAEVPTDTLIWSKTHRISLTLRQVNPV